MKAKQGSIEILATHTPSQQESKSPRNLNYETRCPRVACALRNRCRRLPHARGSSHARGIHVHPSAPCAFLSNPNTNFLSNPGTKSSFSLLVICWKNSLRPGRTPSEIAGTRGSSRLACPARPRVPHRVRSRVLAQCRSRYRRCIFRYCGEIFL